MHTSPADLASVKPHFLGSFKPTPSLRMFKQGSEGRVRTATDQETFHPHENPKVAGPIVWTSILLQAFFLVTIMFTTRFSSDAPQDARMLQKSIDEVRITSNSASSPRTKKSQLTNICAEGWNRIE